MGQPGENGDFYGKITMLLMGKSNINGIVHGNVWWLVWDRSWDFSWDLPVTH
jgi:hypothetical protein